VAAWDEGGVLSRLEILVVTDLGRQDVVSVTFRRDSVEMWAGRRSRGVFDRDELRAWLARPDGSISTDDVRLKVVPAHVALNVSDVLSSWALDDRVLRDLRTRARPA
jgi:hypothetical protein